VQSQQQGTMTTYRAGKERYSFEKLHCYHQKKEKKKDDVYAVQALPSSGALVNV